MMLCSENNENVFLWLMTFFVTRPPGNLQQRFLAFCYCHVGEKYDFVCTTYAGWNFDKMRSAHVSAMFRSSRIWSGLRKNSVLNLWSRPVLEQKTVQSGS